MQALVVEPADPLDGSELELRSAPRRAVADQLGREAVDEAFGIRRGVGVALGFAATLGTAAAASIADVRSAEERRPVQPPALLAIPESA